MRIDGIQNSSERKVLQFVKKESEKFIIKDEVYISDDMRSILNPPLTKLSEFGTVRFDWVKGKKGKEIKKGERNENK